MVDQIRFFAGAARVLEGRAAGEYMKGHTSWVRREPIGVVGQVTPWNYPMMMAIWKIAPALAAGQHRSSSSRRDTTPETTLLLAEIASEFLPAGTFNVVTGDRDTGRAVVEHPTPALVAITGSVRAGMQVAESASREVKRVHLELGGKAPVVVFDDADIEAAVEGIAVAGYFNAGQDCTAATRVLAAPAHPRRLRRGAGRVRRASTAKVGLPDDEDALLGPVNNAQPARAGCRASSTAARPRPRRRRRSPDRPRSATASSSSRPCVSGLRQDDEAIQDEIFGPVITVQRFTDEDEAIRWANGVDYGLASASGPRTSAGPCGCRKALDFGCVWINTHIPLVAEMPHGGFKQSGYGKDLSMYGFEDYTRIKHVMANIDS